MTERWLPVVGHEGKYEVSDLGRVRSLSRDIVQPSSRWGGPRVYPLQGRLLKHSLVFGYPRVELGGVRFRVHVLVLTAFGGPRPAGMEARHLDGNRSNCAATNLTWGTRIENAADKRVHGTIPLGERCGSAKLTAKQVRWVRSWRAVGVKYQTIATHLGVSHATIWHIARGLTWKHVQ